MAGWLDWVSMVARNGQQAGLNGMVGLASSQLAGSAWMAGLLENDSSLG